MLHASTEQPYPPTQHESGVQPRYQPWEQPRYKPCSGLRSTRWVPTGAAQGLPVLLQTLLGGMTASLCCPVILSSFSLPSSWVTLVVPSACINFSNYHFSHIRGNKPHFSLPWPFVATPSLGKPIPVGVSNIRQNLAEVNGFTWIRT